MAEHVLYNNSKECDSDMEKMRTAFLYKHLQVLE